ncbi:hypothetical protein [Longimicrobium sp.]|jgi:hypothetical protein|uniref:hypothetical protein n=1 Tax=Longimicrobium sp. TaxID=2029185 RepID=UPI002ED940B7
MPTLKIDFNCMCLFVTSRNDGAVHVLMPSTAGHGPDHQHLARLVYRDRDGRLQLAPLEGWALSLGKPMPSTDDALTPAEAVRRQALIVNLSDLTDSLVLPELVTGENPDGVISRVTIHSGQLPSVGADTAHKWTLRGRRYFMAHRVTFHIENVPDVLDWTPLGTHPDDDADVPLERLGHVMPEPGTDDNTFALKVYYVTEKGLPPQMNPNLTAEETRHHFAAFYPLLGIRHVDDGLLPERGPADVGTAPPTGMEYCKTAKASM